MPRVEYFVSERSKESMLDTWSDVFKVIIDKGYSIHTEPIECDVSVVLSGKVVNPLPLHGKKVLLYRMKEWQPMKWDVLFAPILEEYYDEMIDITGRDIRKVIEGINNNSM